MSDASPYDRHLDRVGANHTPLTPVDFLNRTAATHPDRLAVAHGARRYTWAQTARRCRRLASALIAHGVRPKDTVAIMAPNIPEMLEAHFGVPMAGAVLNALNIRLDPASLAYMLGHGAARVVLVDSEFAAQIGVALALMDGPAPLVIDIQDAEGPGGAAIGTMGYEAFLETGDPDFAGLPVADEWDAISLSYTSGTTGEPKGVVYHHRGAWLNAVGNIMAWGLAGRPAYLWTLPMFHCNPTTNPWTVTALAGTHVCLRRADAASILDAIGREGVTHLCGAPIIMTMLLNAPERTEGFGRTIEMMTAAAPPPAAVIEGMERMGFHITHVYGLTEVYGPAVVCDWHADWDALPVAERAALKSRQGVRYPVLDGLMVADPATLAPVPADAATIGEVFMRGNIVMKGYLKNPAATDAAFAGGWFHTGDLGVLHPDGYIELKDRAKDIIISGGENISTIEIESVLYRHPAVLEAAVVARPDPTWGETPCAFITLKPGTAATEAEVIAFCRAHLAHFMAPRAVVFGPLPKTSTGKVQKFVLRGQAKGSG